LGKEGKGKRSDKGFSLSDSNGKKCKKEKKEKEADNFSYSLSNEGTGDLKDSSVEED